MRQKIISLLLAVFLIPQLCFSGILFDGSDDYVDVSNSALDFTGNKTISAWVYILTTADYRPIFSRSRVGGGTSNVGYSLEIATGSNKLMYVKQGVAAIEAVNTALPANSWHHVAAVKTGTAVTFYLDGVGETISNSSTEVGGSPPPTYIGRSARNATSWSGSIDDVHIYNRALSAEQMLGLYSSRLRYYAIAGTAPMGIGYWPLDDHSDGTSGDGKKFIDRSNTGKTGTGNDGANDTGLTCNAGEVLSYPDEFAQ